MFRAPPKSTLFPYTTLFRFFLQFVADLLFRLASDLLPPGVAQPHRIAAMPGLAADAMRLGNAWGQQIGRQARSEEATSELQSLRQLRYRLLPATISHGKSCS